MEDQNTGQTQQAQAGPQSDPVYLYENLKKFLESIDRSVNTLSKSVDHLNTNIEKDVNIKGGKKVHEKIDLYSVSAEERFPDLTYRQRLTAIKDERAKLEKEYGDIQKSVMSSVNGAKGISIKQREAAKKLIELTLDEVEVLQELDAPIKQIEKALKPQRKFLKAAIDKGILDDLESKQMRKDVKETMKNYGTSIPEPFIKFFNDIKEQASSQYGLGGSLISGAFGKAGRFIKGDPIVGEALDKADDTKKKSVKSKKSKTVLPKVGTSQKDKQKIVPEATLVKIVNTTKEPVPVVVTGFATDSGAIKSLASLFDEKMKGKANKDSGKTEKGKEGSGIFNMLAGLIGGKLGDLIKGGGKSLLKVGGAIAGAVGAARLGLLKKVGKIGKSAGRLVSKLGPRLSSVARLASRAALPAAAVAGVISTGYLLKTSSDIGGALKTEKTAKEGLAEQLTNLKEKDPEQYKKLTEIIKIRERIAQINSGEVVASNPEETKKILQQKIVELRSNSSFEKLTDRSTVNKPAAPGPIADDKVLKELSSGNIVKQLVNINNTLLSLKMSDGNGSVSVNNTKNSPFITNSGGSEGVLDQSSIKQLRTLNKGS